MENRYVSLKSSKSQRGYRMNVKYPLANLDPHFRVDIF